MKRVHRLIMKSGMAFLIAVGSLPVFAQESDLVKPEAPKPAEKSATATPAQPPADNPASLDKRELSIPEQRAEIDRMAGETLHQLFAESGAFKKQFDQAYGYAVFDNVKLAFLLTGGGGKGVAIEKTADMTADKWIKHFESHATHDTDTNTHEVLDRTVATTQTSPDSDKSAAVKKHDELAKKAADKESMKKGNRTYMNMGAAGVGASIGAHKYQVVFLFENQNRFNDFVNEGWTAEASANAVAGKSGANVEMPFVDGMAVYQVTESGLMLNADIGGTKYWRDEDLNNKIDATDD